MRGVLLSSLFAVPVVIVIIRKCIERKWGYYKGQECLQKMVFLVTGANSGLGKATAIELARRKARVIMACRDIDVARKAVKEIRKEVKTGELIPMEVDLESFRSIRNFVKAVTTCFPRIDVLINNAGVSVPFNNESPVLTKDGFEINLGVNHLGPFLLTNLLIHTLKYSAPSRIVNVSSKLHESGIIDINQLDSPTMALPPGKSTVRNPAYNRSKLANVYFTRELANILNPNCVQAFAVCPGFCYTNLFRHTKISRFQYLFAAIIAFFFMRTAKQGCQTILYCSLSNELKGCSGKIFRDCKVYESKHKFDPEIQSELWSRSSQMVGLY